MYNITTVKANKFTKTRRFFDSLVGIAYFNYNLLEFPGIEVQGVQNPVYIYTQQNQVIDTQKY